MNNNLLKNAFTMNVLTPLSPSLLRKEGDDGFAPLCGAERGWGEFI